MKKIMMLSVMVLGLVGSTVFVGQETDQAGKYSDLPTQHSYEVAGKYSDLPTQHSYKLA